ncbi:MAG: putative DNA base hypermodification protein [Pirellulaceae bacterium]|nr:putative DNA base hypermodification protein [Pirellulaceae bacterium]
MKKESAQQTFWPSEFTQTRRRKKLSSLAPAKPTVVYDTYWRFAAERQATFFRRFNNEPHPWSQDDILQTYKFTNAYRASDRVSQYLIRNVIYNGSQEVEEVFFRTILFKLFNKIGTWEMLIREHGFPSFEQYKYKAFDRTLTKAMANKQTIYSAAYIMPSGSRELNSTKKHRSHLQLLEKMMKDEVPKKIADFTNMREGFELLLSYPMIGDFLAYQYITDLNYSEICDFTEMEFAVPGPGAIDGISKCFKSLGGLNETDIIKLVADRQTDEFERLGIEFQSLWGRPLQLIDCQNLFCEISKYSRVSHPKIKGVANRTRIKQKYSAKNEPIAFWYPPKWQINDRIENKHPAIEE